MEKSQEIYLEDIFWITASSPQLSPSDHIMPFIHLACLIIKNICSFGSQFPSEGSCKIVLLFPFPVCMYSKLFVPVTTPKTALQLQQLPSWRVHGWQNRSPPALYLLGWTSQYLLVPSHKMDSSAPWFTRTIRNWGSWFGKAVRQEQVTRVLRQKGSSREPTGCRLAGNHAGCPASLPGSYQMFWHSSTATLNVSMLAY